MAENKKDKIIAVDLGGTNLRVALVQNNRILKYIKKDTPKVKEELLKDLYKGIRELISKDVVGIGMGSPGPLEKGIIKNPPNIPLKYFNIKKELSRRFKKRVEIENDAKCVALAEARLGCKKKNFVIFTFGTGIGGGIIVNGELYKGKGFAGEFGSIVLNNGKTFEDLWKECRESIKNNFGEKILIKDLIKMNNDESNMILGRIIKISGQGIASIINVFDPEIVVLSGGIRETGEIFLNKIKKEIKKYNVLPRRTEVIWTKLEHPGTLGASLLVE